MFNRLGFAFIPQKYFSIYKFMQIFYDDSLNMQSRLNKTITKLEASNKSECILRILKYDCSLALELKCYA